MEEADEAGGEDEEEAAAVLVGMLDCTGRQLKGETAQMSRSNNKKATRAVHGAQERRVVDLGRKEKTRMQAVE